LASPLYTAVIEWAPTARLDAVKPAVLPERAALPKSVLPSLNVTIPVVTPDEVTSAVKVTAWPATEGFSEELTVVEVDAFVTVCITASELLRWKPTLPA
jgi:hypothetical protein